ncbi:MAG TPA: BrnT family toxin, partial [Devosia sp.]|nr:BrnT family toxin [Devosia sp.]
MRFSWDANKAASNLRKHGVAFEDAARVFLDPLSIREQDRIVDGEERWPTIGTCGNQKLVVARTATDDQSG